MTYITVFIALVLLSNQGCVYHEKQDECGELVRLNGLPAPFIEAMCAADWDIPQSKLHFTKDLLKELDEINNLKIKLDLHDNHVTDTTGEGCLFIDDTLD